MSYLSPVLWAAAISSASGALTAFSGVFLIGRVPPAVHRSLFAVAWVLILTGIALTVGFMVVAVMLSPVETSTSAR